MSELKCRVCHSMEPVFRDGLCQSCYLEFPHKHIGYVDPDETVPVPPRLAEHVQPNLETIVRAAKAGDLAAVSAVRRKDKAAVALLCAMTCNEDGTFSPVPFAEMISDDPFELYFDPTV